ncbi:MAG: hypothetical protein ACRD0W_09590 [Acidimicrobiales bacterium]
MTRLRPPALRRWHVLAALFAIGLACWWIIVETLPWAAGTLTGGTP